MGQLVLCSLGWQIDIIISWYGCKQDLMGYRIYRRYHVHIGSGYDAYISFHINSADVYIERLLCDINCAGLVLGLYGYFYGI